MIDEFLLEFGEFLDNLAIPFLGFDVNISTLKLNRFFFRYIFYWFRFFRFNRINFFVIFWFNWFFSWFIMWFITFSSSRISPFIFRCNRLNINHTLVIVIHKVLSSEFLPFTTVNLKSPRGSTIATRFSTSNSHNVESRNKINVKVKKFGFSTLPDIFLGTNLEYAINIDSSTMTEISRNIKFIISIFTRSENSDISISNILINTTAKFLVRYLSHGVNFLFTVTLRRYEHHFVV